MADADTGSTPETVDRIEIYADYVCPFCYLGTRSLAQYCERRDEPLVVEWHPFDRLGQAKMVQYQILELHPTWVWGEQLGGERKCHASAEIERDGDELIVAQSDGTDLSSAEAMAICLAALEATLGEGVQLTDQ